MSEPDAAPSMPGYRDRRTGLILFGVLLIVIGCVNALLALVLLTGLAPAARFDGLASPPQVTAAGSLTYALLAVMFAWLGAGSVLTRRWAPPLILTVGWVWLISGVIGVGAAVLLLPSAFAMVETQTGPLSADIRLAMTLNLLGMLSVAMLFLPAAIILFYRSRSVEATCAARDPMPRWTDRCPLSLLGLSLSLVLLALSLLPSMLSDQGAVPCFGVMVTGPAGLLINLALMAVWLYGAWSLCRRDPWGWWATVISMTLATASAVVTFLRVDAAEVYRSMGLSAGLIAPIGLPGSGAMIAIAVACWLSVVGYLLYVRKLFVPRG